MPFRPTCAKCNKEMNPIKNQVQLVHFMNNNPLQGIDEMQEGDLYECPVCHCQVVTGLAELSRLGFSIHKDHNKLIERLKHNDEFVEVIR